MTLIQDIFRLFAKPVPAPYGQPGDFYLPQEGEVAVKKELARRNLPVIEYTESNYPGASTYGGYIFYVPASVKGDLGNLGQGKEGQYYPRSGITATSYYDWTRQTAKKAGADLSADPLGLNYLAASQGKEPVVQYKKLATAGLPDWYPQPSAPSAMSGASIIFDPATGRPKKVITGSAGSFLEYDIVELSG